jgi:POT family proton-dependent oligopeptide transporter
MPTPTPEPAYRTTPLEISTMPPGVPFIIGNEAAERFSFYGMKAILAVFMTQHLLDSKGNPAFMSEESAREWVHNFNTAVYFFPVFGAIVADWLFGKYRTIIALSLVYCAGHAVLATMDVPHWLGLEPKMLLGVGLGLIAVGGGGIKPCVSAHVGDQFGHANQHLLPRVFWWFYFSINFGAMFSQLIIPKVLESKDYGPGWAFGIPGALMGIATIVFWMGRNRFVHVPPAGAAFWKDTFGKAGWRAIGNLAPLYLFVAMFWGLFDQTGAAWVLQAEAMERTVAERPLPADFDPENRPTEWSWLDWALSPTDVAPRDTVQRWELLSSQLQAVNPLVVMVLIPLFTYGLYPLLGKIVELTALRKVGIGLFITVGSYLVVTWIQTQIEIGGRPHIGWQVVAYIIITCAEILVSITTLEFAYTQAPPRMKSFIMGLYLLSMSLGNLFVARVNAYIQEEIASHGKSPLDGANYYWFFTACMLASAVGFVLWSSFYRGRTYVPGEAPGSV